MVKIHHPDLLTLQSHPTNGGAPNPTYEVAENHDQSIRDHGHQSLISPFRRRSGYSLISTMIFQSPGQAKIYFRRSNDPPRLRKTSKRQNSISSGHPFRGLVDGFDQTEMLKLASSRGTQVRTVFSRFFLCVCACLCWEWEWEWGIMRFPT